MARKTEATATEKQPDGKETANGKTEKLPDIVYKWLPVKLSDDELKIKNNELIQAMDKEDEIEGKRDAASKDFKAQLKGQKNKINLLRGVLRTGIEHRDVECVEEFDYANLTVNTIRSDTKETVNKRAMTQDERQRALFNKKKDEEKATAKPKTKTAAATA